MIDKKTIELKELWDSIIEATQNKKGVIIFDKEYIGMFEDRTLPLSDKEIETVKSIIKVREDYYNSL